MIKSKLDPHWDDFFEQFVRTLLADGYNEWDILNKAISIINDVKESHQSIVGVITQKEIEGHEEKEVTASTEQTKDKEEFVPRYRHTKRGMVINRSNSTNYPKTLSTKFEHAEVYIVGAKDESLATIEVGPNNKTRDVFRLVKTGEELTEKDYLIRFNKFINPEATDEWGYRNKSRIVFKANPKVNVGTVKHPKNYYKMSSIDDVVSYVSQRGRRPKKERV